jgi:hypothetical protein
MVYGTVLPDGKFDVANVKIIVVPSFDELAGLAVNE